MITGVVLMTLQNSVAGHLAGKGSLLDDVLHALAIHSHGMGVFPEWAALLILVGFPLAAVAVRLSLRETRQPDKPRATQG